MQKVNERVTLGATELEISPLGIGTWAWGDKLVWGYGQGYNDANLREVFDTASAAGINLFDTAEVYGLGQSETLLGKFIRQAECCECPPSRSGEVSGLCERGAEGQNMDCPIVATKFMPFPWRLGKRALLRALRKSLRRLQLACVDLYQIHWPIPLVALETWMDALADAVEAGLTRAVGVSNYSAEQMGRAHNALARRGVRLASNQVEYSLLKRAPEFNGVLQLCRDLNVTLIAYSPLGMGVLTGKYTPDSPPPLGRRLRFNRAFLERVQPLLALMREIGETYGKTPAQIALNWTICKGAVPIPGAKTARHAEQNVGALGWRLTVDEIRALDEASYPFQESDDAA
jgi:aryl-alcohol dehydrogenase-like predicted oxidoreductase